MNKKTAFGAKFRSFSEKFVILYLMIAVAVGMSFYNKNYLSLNNLVSILRSMAVQGIMACSMTMVLVNGDIDLSFTSIAAFGPLLSSILAEKLSQAGIMPVTGGILLGLAISVLAAILIGHINAYLIYIWKMPAMIVTLAMQYIVYGLAGIISKGWAYYTLPDWWKFFGTNRVFNDKIPICVFIFLLVWAAFYVVMNHTKFGRSVYAVGGNAEAARLSGINVYRVKKIVLSVNQLCSLLAGIVLSSQIMSTSASLASTLALTVVAAVIIGGTSISGGGGSVLGTLLGLAFLQVIINAMTIANLTEYPQYIARGLMIIFAIMLNIVQSRPKKKKTDRKRA